MRVIQSQAGQTLILGLVLLAVASVGVAAFQSAIESERRQLRGLSELISVMNVESVIASALSESANCVAGLSQPIDSTSITPATPQDVVVNQILVSSTGGAPALVSINAPFSTETPSLIVTGIRLRVTSATSANWVIDFDSTKLVRSLQAVVPARITLNTTVPTAATVETCQSEALASPTVPAGDGSVLGPCTLPGGRSNNGSVMRDASGVSYCCLPAAGGAYWGPAWSFACVPI